MENKPYISHILSLENTVMDGDFALWGSMLETDLIENDKIDQLKEIGGIRSQNLLSFCSLFIFYLLEWSRARVCWVTDSVHMGFTIITVGHCAPRFGITAEAWLHMGTQLIVHVPIQTEMLENKKIYFHVYQNQESCFDLWKYFCRVNFLRLELLISFLKKT